MVNEQLSLDFDLEITPIKRPCLRTYTLSNGEVITPNDVNYMASSAERLAAWMLKNKGKITEDELYIVAEAVLDNWKRFWSSC